MPVGDEKSSWEGLFCNGQCQALAVTLVRNWWTKCENVGGTAPVSPFLGADPVDSPAGSSLDPYLQATLGDSMG
jgi:hypothetical protein